MINRLNAALEGRYSIREQVGEGGMATVFLADDLKHERKVALKVLKPELAAVVGAERFLAEIKLTANLQHPHILPLYDSGEADSFLYYVMPFVGGATLSDRLETEKQLPVDEAVRIASAVANALDFAHRQGVVHRDIKPGNILFQDSQPVVSDFGIALAVGAGSGARLTETGLSLGTPHYMSPEQATGDQQVGPASDIYALGCVLYEMLAGAPPFSGGTAQSVLGQIITKSPEPVTERRKAVPANVAASVAKALEKVPADRFRDASGFASALANPGFRHGDQGSMATGPAIGWTWSTTVFAAATAALAVALLFSMSWRWGELPEEGPASPEIQARLYVGEGVEAEFDLGLALSPSGDRLAFVGQDADGVRSVWIRDMHTEDPTPVPGTQNGVWPFWSPDGGSLAFTANGKLRAVNLGTGASTALCDTNWQGRGAWSNEGVILFYNGESPYRVNAGGGECRPVPHSPERALFDYPNFLPDGQRYLFSTGNEGSTYVGELGSDETREIIPDAGNILFIRPHWLLFTGSPLGGLDARGLLSVMAQRLDMATLALVGDPVPVFSGVVTPNGEATYTASANGLLVGVRTSGEKDPLVWVGRDRRVTGRVPMPDDPFTFAVSHDETRLAMGGWGFWIHDLDRSISDRISLEAGEKRITWFPAWSPGDTLLVFSAVLDGPALTHLYDVRDGSVRTLPGDTANATGPHAWSPDGTAIAFVRRTVDSRGRRGEVWIHDLASGESHAIFPAVMGSASASLQFSPDGRWLLYESTEGGTSEIYVRSYPQIGAPRQVSSGGGRSGHWSTDGRTIVYEGPTGRVMAVSAQLDDGLSLGSPQVAQDSDEFSGLNGVSRDGSRFLRFHRGPEARVPRLRVVTGWTKKARESSGDGGNP
jgi:serine/threonine-protein kinase